jgi:hypothetical protein
LGEFDFESDELVGVVGRVKDIRGTAFGVVGPAEHLGEGRFWGLGRTGGVPDARGPCHKNEEQCLDAAHLPAISRCSQAFSSELPEGQGVGPTYLHKKSHSNILPAGDLLRLAPGVGASWGSAGSVLRSQGTLGQEELSR